MNKLYSEDIPVEPQKIGSPFEDPNYLKFLYSEERRPKTDYPSRLATYLRDNWFGETGALLDIGCGRGDMLKALFDVGFNVAGTDLSPVSEEAIKPHPFSVSNLENTPLPYDEGSFDFVFSKSVIEHMHDPIPLLKQAKRVLRLGGKAVIMTPSWMHHRWGPFYLDHTHVTPFTLPSLRDAMNLAGFQDVKVVHFYQLPILWQYPFLTLAIRIFASLPLRYRPMYDINLPNRLNTFIRFSKEVMLLGFGVVKTSS